MSGRESVETEVIAQNSQSRDYAAPRRVCAVCLTENNVIGTSPGGRSAAFEARGVGSDAGDESFSWVKRDIKTRQHLMSVLLRKGRGMVLIGRGGGGFAGADSGILDRCDPEY